MKSKLHGKPPGQLRKNLDAMALRNMTGKQMRPICRRWRLWYRVSANLRQVEGSWYGAIKRYMHIFKA